MKTVRLFIGTMLVFFMAFAPMEAKAHKGQHGKHKHGVYTPYWIPSHIATNNVRHVYLPDYECYYDRWQGTFTYVSRGRWVVNSKVPHFLKRVNLNRVYVVALRTRAPRPYTQHARYRAGYRPHGRLPRSDGRIVVNYESNQCYPEDDLWYDRGYDDRQRNRNRNRRNRSN